MVAEYRHGYACQDVSLRLIEEWKNVLENRKCVGAVLIDLSQEFDCLAYQLLVIKTEGTMERVLVRAFLSGLTCLGE